MWRLTSPTGETYYGIGMDAVGALASLGVTGAPQDAAQTWSATELSVGEYSAHVRVRGREAVAEFERLGGFAPPKEGVDVDDVPALCLRVPPWVETVYYGLGDYQEVRSHIRTRAELDKWIERGDVDELWLDLEIPSWYANPPAGTHPDDGEEY